MTLRAVLIGLALVIVQTAITPYNDYYLQGTDISGNHFPLGAVFTLIFLAIVVNPILKKVVSSGCAKSGGVDGRMGNDGCEFSDSIKRDDRVLTPVSGGTRLFCYA